MLETAYKEATHAQNGVEYWPIKQQHMNKMSVAETSLLRWMYGENRKDKIRNEHFKEQLEVASIGDTSHMKK